MKLPRWSLAAALLCSSAFAQDNTTCHDYVLVTVRGTGEAQGPSVGFIKMINETLRLVPNGVEHDLVYPAAAANIQVSTAIGGVNLANYINESYTACPSQKYAVLGYSQGAAATILGTANYKPGNPLFKAIKAILVIGNPGHQPFEFSNVDELGGSATQAYLGAFTNIGLRFPRFWYKSTKLFDICYTGDSICAPDYTNSSFARHLLYGIDETVQSMGALFLRSRISGSLTGD